MDPSKIELSSIPKLFEYEKMSREIEQCDNINEIKNVAKCFIKLYLSQQEIVAKMGIKL